MSENTSGPRVLTLNLAAAPKQTKADRSPILKVGEWEVKQYFEDNDFPQAMIDLYTKSPTHNGIIYKKAIFTAGSRLKAVAKWPDQQLQVDAIAGALGGNEGIHDLFAKVILDDYLYGGYAIMVYTNEAGKVAGFKHMDYSLIRRACTYIEGKDGEKIERDGFVYSPDWRDEQVTKEKAFWVEPYDPEALQPESFYVVYRVGYSPGKHYYPLPSYNGALLSIRTEIELITFKHSSTINTFSPGGVLEVPGEMTDQQWAEFNKQMELFGNGTENAGKVLVINTRNADDKPLNFTPFSNSPANKDVSSYLDSCRNEIVVAHQITSITMLGLPGGPSISGDASTLTSAINIFMETIVKPNRASKIDDFIWLFGHMGYDVTFEVEELKVLQSGGVDTVKSTQDGGTNEGI